MKDIVEDALEHAEQLSSSETVSTDEFGPPEFLYVGIGDRGTTRLMGELSPVGSQLESEQPIEDLVTRVAFQSKLAQTPGDLDQIDQYVDDPQTLSDLDQQIDCCFLTADLNEPSVITKILSVAQSTQDSLVIALLTTSTDPERDITRQLHEVVGTTVLIKDSDSQLDAVQLEDSRQFDIDQVVQHLITDFIKVVAGHNPIPVDYARIWDQWDSGRSAVPFFGKFQQPELKDVDLSTSISFIGPSTHSSTDWFGYAWSGPSFTLEEFEHLRRSLDTTLRSNSKDRGGILGFGVDEGLEKSVFVSGVQFVDEDV